MYGDGAGDDGHPAGIAQVYKNEVYGLKQDKKPKVDFLDLFDKMCELSDGEIPV